MPAMVSLLRGVNLASHKRVRMDALRELYASLGLRDVQTYVQSGNVIFRAKAGDPVRLARRIEAKIESTFGFHSDVVLRTTAEMRNVVANNPFALRRAVDPARFIVTFLAEDPATDVCAAIRGIKCSPEEFHLMGREIYSYFPDGFARSKLPALMDRVLKKTGTARNWNTVLKLVELTEAMEKGE